MLVSKVRGDGVFDGFVELPDGTSKIPPGHSFSLPGDIPAGHYAVMMGGWKIVNGEKPIYPTPPSKEEVETQLYKEIVNSTQKRLDDFANTRGYDGILSACTYATSTIEKFRVEGQYCVEARDATWARLYQILEEVKAGTRQVPAGYNDIEKELPILKWVE